MCIHVRHSIWEDCWIPQSPDRKGLALTTALAVPTANERVHPVPLACWGGGGGTFIPLRAEVESSQIRCRSYRYINENDT